MTESDPSGPSGTAASPASLFLLFADQLLPRKSGLASWTGKEIDGIERVVLALIPHEGTTALAVVKKLVLKESDNPDANAVRWFTTLAKIEGLVEVDEGFFNDKVEPVAERVAGLESAFVEVRTAWTTFQDREPDLYNALLGECTRGIDSMTTRTV